MHILSKYRISTRLMEFFLIGLIMGITEDVIAIMLATDAKLSLNIILIAGAVAIPFAFLSEIIVDHPDFWKKLTFTHKKRSKKKSR